MVLGGSSSGGRLGTAILDLRANAGPLDRGLERSEDNVRRSTGRMGKSVKLVGLAFAGAGVAAAGIGVASLKLAADFDKAFSEVRTLLPKVSDEAFGALQKDLRDFSNETGTVTTEAIPALYQAISAGVPRENVMDFLRVANKAAVGGVTDLETAVDAITSTVNAYGPEVLSATQASDIMFTAVRLGKCVTGDTRVLLADGRYERIDRLKEGGTVVSFDGRGFTPMRAGWVEQGVKPTVRLTTRLGRSITTTWTHPYLTERGWKEVRDLEVGDRIAVPTHLPYFGKRSVPKAESGLLGLWLAEGATSTSSPRIASTDYGDQIAEWATTFGCEVINREKREGKCPQWNIVTGRRNGGHTPNPVTEMLRGYGLEDCTSATKRIPEAVYTWDRASVAHMLRWLFNGDGWLADLRKRRTGFQVGFCSKSEHLVRDVQHLMLRFGIVGRVRQRGDTNAWEWAVNRWYEVNRFVEMIGLDRPAASRVASHKPKKQRARWGVVEYDPIVSIEPVGDAPVYDLTVPQLHNFVAEDIIAHNTTFDELGASLFNVVPTAASFGVGLDQVSAALAVTTAQGVPTKIATTQLRQAFVEAGKESSILAKTIKERTGKSFSQLIKEGKPVHRIFQDLREDMPEDDFRNLFSSVEAANAALLITGDAAERVDDALAEMSTSAGATDKAFATVADTATFRMQKAMNLMRNVLLEIGIALLPALVEVLDRAVLPALTAFAGWMSDHSDEMAAGVIAVVDAAEELGSATKTAVNDAIAAYTRFVTWGENNVDRAKAFWTDTTAAATAHKNEGVVTAQYAYIALLRWGSENKAELEQFWQDITSEAASLQETVNGQADSVTAAYGDVLTWSTTNKPTLIKFWSDLEEAVNTYIQKVLELPDSIAIPAVVLPQPSLPRLPGLPFAKDEPMLPASADTETVIKEIDEALGQVEERLGNINDDWLTMAALVVTLGGLLLGGPFGWIGAGIGATRLLKKFLPDIRTWLAENNAAIAKELDPLLWGLEESLAAAWGEGLPEVPPEALQKAPEDRNWLFQWWIDNEERFKGAADAIADGIRNVTKALKEAELNWTDFWPFSQMEATAKVTLHAVAAIAWLIDRLDELDDAWESFKGFIDDIIDGLNAIIIGWNNLEFTLPKVEKGPFKFGGWTISTPDIDTISNLDEGDTIPRLDEGKIVIGPMPDDSALGSLATALGSIGGGRTMVFNVENLYGVDDLEDFVQEANLAALRRGQENVLT